jgi:hypothetical protein
MTVLDDDTLGLSHEQREVGRSLVEAGYSNSYIRSAYTTLSGILRAAAVAKLIREAPTLGIELPAPQA